MFMELDDELINLAAISRIKRVFSDNSFCLMFYEGPSVSKSIEFETKNDMNKMLSLIHI